MALLGNSANAENGELSVAHFYHKHRKHLNLKLIAGAQGLQRVIKEKTLNRPVLALVGYFKHFGEYRVQFFGKGECGFLTDLPEAKQREFLERFMSHAIPCIIAVGRQNLPKLLVEFAEKKQIPLFRTTLNSRDFTAEATILLERIFAKTQTIHGTLVDVKGIGVLLLGESGIGKTECVLALIEKGYTFVADDAVKIHSISRKVLIGSALALNHGYMECRGIGIINVIQTFGVRAFCPEKSIDLVVELKTWQPGMEDERTGLKSASHTLLGVRIPCVTILVRLGRDIPRLVEIAALVQGLKQIGYNPAREFNRALIRQIAKNRLA